MKRRPRCCFECGTVIDSGEAMLVSGHLTLDRALRTVEWRGRPVKLSRKQIEIVEMLVQREGRVVQRWAFFISVIDEESEEQTLDILICQIRAAFRLVDPDFDRLATQWGEGYRWQRAEAALEAVAA